MAADLIGRPMASGGCHSGNVVASGGKKANSTPAIVAGTNGLGMTTFPAFRMPIHLPTAGCLRPERNWYHGSLLPAIRRPPAPPAASAM